MILRNLVFYSILLPSTVILGCIGLCFFFAPYNVRYWIITRWSHLFTYLAKIILGLNYHVEGLDNIPKKNVIVFSNHQSAWETLFFQVLLPPQTWVLKKELLYIPLFGWCLRLLDPIAVNRKNMYAMRSLIEQGTQRLSQGRFIIIFPEGTRLAPDNNVKFKRSGAALAEATQTPILPIAHNAGLFWPRGFFAKRSGTIHVQIGPLISVQNKTVDEINADAENWIKKHKEELRKEKN